MASANAAATLGVGLALDGSHGKGDDLFRIGHMGYVNLHMVMGVLGSIEAGLVALDIPHGSGALEAAAQTAIAAQR